MGYDMHFRDGSGCDWEADGQPGYFRLNIFGMRQFRDAMAERGMIFDSVPPGHPDWDDREAVDAWLSWHGPEIPGIPVHKFCSNDGWIVTPAECEAAVKIARASSLPDPDEYWSRWLDYMDRARAHGGFEVH